jgi:inner membrane transporter RhtA
MSRTPAATRPHSLALPIGYTVGGMVFVQAGASVAKGLFPLAGPAGVASLRLCFAGLLMLLIWRPWRHPVRPGALRHIFAYGVALGLMNLSFYAALSRIPLGITVAFEFLGPLGLALLHSTRRLDVLWVLCAAIGVYLLLPVGPHAVALDPLGIGFALLAGTCWALYIVYAQKAGAGGRAHAAAYGGVIAALVVVPFGIALAGTRMLEPRVVGLGVVVAVLSSAIPYSLEMIALARIPARTFGILMSLEPALAALSGFLLLGERLQLAQLAAIALVMVASGGSVLTRGTEPVPLA